MIQEVTAEEFLEPSSSSRKRGRGADLDDVDAATNERHQGQGDERRVETRLSSQIGAVHGYRQQRSDFIPESSKPEIQQVYQQADTLNRNKRLFGSLMGHLGQAKQKLEQETEKLERLSQRVHEIKEKSDRGARRLEEAQRRKLHQEMLDAKIEAVSQLTEDWKRYMHSISHFILTDAEPRLAWLPSSHNSTSRSLLDRRNDEILKKIAERELLDTQQVRQIQQQWTLHTSSRDDSEAGHETELPPISSQDHGASDNVPASRDDLS